MLGHLAVPDLDEESKPASLSKKIIDLLKTDLEFEGIIISDALEMKAISENFTSGLASELSLRAGNHIALIPEDADEAIEHLVNVFKTDLEFRKEVQTKIEKIRELKSWVNSVKPITQEGSQKDRFLQHEKIALQIARRAIEINAPKILTPIDESKQIAMFAFLQSDHSFKQASMFFNLMQSATEGDIDFAYINEEISHKDLVSLRTGILEADVIIFANFYRSEAYNGGIGTADKIAEIQHEIAGDISKINIFFGNPYLSESLRSDMEIKAFSDSLCSLGAVTMILTGRELGEEKN
jgi:beta-glucosidase-like glycosyl hydrolase